jgi:hypothetical protein
MEAPSIPQPSQVICIDMATDLKALRTRGEKGEVREREVNANKDQQRPTKTNTDQHRPYPQGSPRTLSHSNHNRDGNERRGPCRGNTSLHHHETAFNSNTSPIRIGGVNTIGYKALDYI